MALGAAMVCALLVFGAIQVFGDPSAAGPRRIVSLAPNDAAANAPTISFADASDPLEAGEYQSFGLEELPEFSGEIGEIDSSGELRVAVVESPQQSVRPNVQPLPRAPLAGLTEQGAHGPLPIVAANGRTPAQAYARPFTPQQGRPMIAVVIGGLGFNARATTQAIEELPPEITLSFVPYAQNLQSWIDRARAHGHEVLLELPMEPFDPDADDTGPQTLLASAPAQQNVQRLEQLLSRGAGYFGVTNYQGARFATSAQASQPIVQQLRRRGLVFLTSGIGQRTALSVEAQRASLPVTAADRIIDARREADAIDDQLLNLEALALQNQSAIGAGFAYPVTMEQVGRWARDIESRGYQLAPASAVLNARAARR
ncbi:MAG TPA: divergent polysaccharide deacetylase family protein [Vitreimonas sp.]|uniref:divergent polysaccharide deacetylase family protein n=1 Tax=Vitreimonas sp. TaxID=3069702 RepID=UPI002D5376AE|nr:divergent polysaccharide deacetylase family protein [Vitreimonas sp.]HYD89709.1 divergent polysaccharide deacetylase family protein [Vitreimonas sp.]